MCGIVAMISRKTHGFYHSDLELMESLLLLDTLRGPDSTGLFTVMRDKSICMTKIGSHPLHLYQTAAWPKHKNKAVQHGKIIVGHNRKATSGAINSENAHPFHEENIVLVHNGMVRGGHKKMAETEVDSHAVCHAFNEKGAEEVLKTLDAAFAFVWWDISKQKLFAVRNDERPLTLTTTEDLFILASEAWMPSVLLGRSNPSKKVLDQVVIEPGVLYEFGLDGSCHTKKIDLRKDAAPVVHYLEHHQGRGWTRRGPAWTNESDVIDDDVDDVLPGVIPLNRTAIRNAIDQTMACGAPFASHVDFEKGEVIQCRVYNIKTSPAGNQSQVSGTCTEPGKPQIDIVGFVDGLPKDRAVQDLLGTPLLATVTGFASSNCGPSMWVDKIGIATLLETHMGDVTQKDWDYILVHERCKHCGNMIHDDDRAFTSVQQRATSKFRITCADCVESRLPNGEIKDAFNQRRLDALQDGESVSQESTGVPVEPPKTESGATIH